MNNQYGFHVNISKCIGCKTCEMACRDAYDLGDTSSFRRVCEFSGGQWSSVGSCWTHDVYAFYVSIACNHCNDPICQKMCPSGAMRKNECGFVLLDSDVCIGCGACALSCPYGAPSYSYKFKVMRKCDGCHALVAQGCNPICVDACPMRAINFGPIEMLNAQYGNVSSVASLPPKNLTDPNVVFTLSQDSLVGKGRVSELANPKEVL